MTDRQKQIGTRFLVGLLLSEIPIITAALQVPNFDWRILLAGLLGGFGAALEKVWSSQLPEPEQAGPNPLTAPHG